MVLKIFEVSISGVDPVTHLNTALTKTSETEMKKYYYRRL